MNIIETTFEKLPTKCLLIGFEGENLRATVRIDCASVFAEYPNATPALIVKPLFADAYPVVVDRNGTDVDWLITSEILSFNGDGEIQLVFYKDEVICKSAVSKIRVCRSLQVTGDMPDPVAQWIDDANRKLAEVDAQIVELEGMVDTATDAATRAEQSASTASTKAEQAAGSAATATEKATEATNAAGTATAKAAEAEQSALTATEKANAAADSERIATAKAGDATTAAGTATAKAEQATEAAQTSTEKAGDASASARAAQESATDAAASATAASESETAAKASETAAGASATQAAQSAQGASADAQTATQKAAEAQQSATGATQSEQTATQKAGEAAASAQAASDARTAVEQTAEQLAESLEQIEQNTRDIADHEQYAEATYATKDDLYKKADIIKNTASGTIASFPDGADGHPVDELKVSIEPVQDLHGYDHPWPAGGGNNLWGGSKLAEDISNAITSAVWDKTAKTIKIPINAGSSGSDAQIVFTNGIVFEENTVYTLITDGTAAVYLNMMFKYTDGTTDRSLGRGMTIGAFSSASGKTVQNVVYRSYSGETVLNYERCGLFKGSVSASAFTPYSNICPITGWNQVKVTRTGKNLFTTADWESSGEIIKIDSNSMRVPQRSYQENYNRYVFGKARPKTFSFKVLTESLDGSAWFRIYLRDSNGSSIREHQVYLRSVGYEQTVTIAIPDNAAGISIGGWAYTGRVLLSDMQMEFSSTATDYEPYAGNTYDITLPTEAGTVYGGELTVNADGSGSLAVDRARVDMGELSWVFMNVNGTQRLCTVSLNPLPLTPKSDYYFPEIICSTYNVERVSQLPNIPYSVSMGYSGYGYGNRLIVNDETITTVEQAVEKLSGQTCVYKLLTPLTYTLTASQIRTLLGQNHIWSDAGDVSVKYNADTKLYIDNKITQAIAAALNA